MDVNMDIVSARERILNHRIREQNSRTQSRNMFARRQLQDRLLHLRTDQEKHEYLMNKSIKQVREEMWRSEVMAYHPEADDCSIIDMRSEGPGRVSSAASILKSYRIKSAPNLGVDMCGYDRYRAAAQPTTPTPPAVNLTWRNKYLKIEVPKCKFRGNCRCDMFPCKPPCSYTNIGFDVKHGENRPAKKFVEATYVSGEDRERLLLDVEAMSVRRPLRTAVDQTFLKEQSLRKIIVCMKYKREQGQPQDWNINYGKPTPKRKLHKAARPSPAAMSL